MGDELLLIDSMALAYEAFQGSRHLVAGTEPLLSLLVRTLPLVEERDALRLEVPASWARALAPYHQTAIRCEPGADPGRPRNKHLLPAIACGAQDLLRLWPAGAHAAVCSLGYALHNLPGLVRSGERFDPRGFRFCFRIAASCWPDLSPTLREVLCGLCGIDPLEAQRRVAEEGFVIHWFRGGRPGDGSGGSGPSA